MWSEGDSFLARYESADGVIRGALPLRVVGERNGYLATWLPADTTVAMPMLADGRGLRDCSGEIRAEGERVVRMFARWDPPFSDAWEDWRPEASWPIPALPEDWAA